MLSDYALEDLQLQLSRINKRIDKLETKELERDRAVAEVKSSATPFHSHDFRYTDKLREDVRAEMHHFKDEIEVRFAELKARRARPKGHGMFGGGFQEAKTPSLRGSASSLLANANKESRNGQVYASYQESERLSTAEQLTLQRLRHDLVKQKKDHTTRINNVLNEIPQILAKELDHRLEQKMRHVRAELQQSISSLKDQFEADGLVSMHRHINARVRDEVHTARPTGV